MYVRLQANKLLSIKFRVNQPSYAANQPKDVNRTQESGVRGNLAIAPNGFSRCE